MWLSVEEFKLWNDVDIDDEKLQKLINSAEEMFKAKFFIKRQFTYSTKRTTFKYTVDWYLADSNRDWNVDENDVFVYKTDGRTRTDLKIVDFRYTLQNYSFVNSITQTTYKPLSYIKITVDDYNFNKEKIVVEFFVSPINFYDDRHRYFVKQYVNLLTQQMILNRFLIGTMDGGITSWSLNGVSVSTSPDVIQNQIEKLNERMRELVMEYGVMYYETF